jgi:hypothetical protein
VLDRLDFLLRVRLRGAPAAIGAAFVGALAVSLLLFFLFGNSRTARILFFPSQPPGRIVAEIRFVPRHPTLEENVEETADNVLLGPTRHDALRLFPRGATVTAVMVSGRTLYIDLTPQVLVEDPEVPLKGQAALAALTRSLKLNFPRFGEVVFFIDGQAPRFSEKKKI